MAEDLEPLEPPDPAAMAPFDEQETLYRRVRVLQAENERLRQRVQQLEAKLFLRKARRGKRGASAAGADCSTGAPPPPPA